MGMVVRSNIMALNANRQLGMNNSAVSKSLEKLSSGFKINRAGDDASGLAISEKMKAQIKGLETASANSQDGISLVQTAEGALTEVHDMLNRMVELAEKAANGTMETVDGVTNGGEYGDAGTDRNAIQDEMDALATEIDRIADSTNFNNIKLLDGSLAKIDATPSGGAATQAMANYGVMALDAAPQPVASATPQINYSTGVEGTPVGGTAAVFEIDFSGVSAGDSGATGTMEVTIGGATVTVANVAAGASGATFAQAVADAISGAGGIQIGGATFNATVSGESLVLTAAEKKAVAAPSFSIESSDLGVSGTSSGTVANPTSGANPTMSGAVGGTTTFAFTSAETPQDGDLMTIGGHKFQFLTSGSSVSAESGATTITLPSDGSFAVLVSNISAAFAAASGSISGASSISITTGGTVSITSSSATPVKAFFGEEVTDVGGVTYAPVDLGTGTVATGTTIEMDFSSVISATGANFGSGAIMNINGKYYEFVPATSANPAAAGDSAGDTIKVAIGATADDSLKNLADAITANDPSLEVTYAAGKMSVKTTAELPAAPAWEMTTAGTGGTITTNQFQSPYTNATVVPSTVSNGGLILQIGDTNDSFNKLTVSIEDMHMSSLFGDTGVTGLVTQAIGGTGGVVTLDVSNQENAGHALTAIKKAINSVSTQRAKLGAVQNRLEHTINNLDVAAENMSAANSRIRDTDMAKQMMDYTKMNVLTQAAQAMLAQANQQPQSVLQLLQ